MKNFVQKGDSLEFVAPAGGVVSGQGYAFGSATEKLVGVADHDADAAERAIFATEGVFEFGKLGGEDFVEGEPVYWDDTAKLIKKSAVGYIPCGYSVQTTAGAATKIEVKLSGQPGTLVT